jgi:Protein of unknown function (DUF3592)
MDATNVSISLRRKLFKTLAILVGIGIATFGIQERMAISHLKKVGISATVDPIESYKRVKSKGSTTFSAEFHFKTEAGQDMSRRRPFPEELIQDFNSGVPVKIFYDPKNPSDFVFDKETASWLPFGMSAGFIVAAIFLI